MMFGIYDQTKNDVVLDPTEDLKQLREYLMRVGIDIDVDSVEVGFSSHGYIVCESSDDIERSRPGIGYYGRIVGWHYNSESGRIERYMSWHKSDIYSFERELYDLMAAEETRALRWVKTGYTDEAVETWGQQRSEADKWTADNTASVPLLQSQATERGITVAELVEKVLAKANQAAAVTGLVLGSVQGAGDKIEALKASEELPADWFEQMQAIADTWQANWSPELLGGLI